MDTVSQHFDLENIKATAISVVIALTWLQIFLWITSKKWLPYSGTRKLLHITIGPLFILCWNLYPKHSPSAAYYAAAIPLGIVSKFAALGLGILKDDLTVRSMSRSGNPRELLKGPLFYGIIFVLSTVMYWAHTPLGITALMLLCVGDGFAGLLGAMYGKSKLPWNRNKSWFGSFCFFSLSLLSSLLFTDLFNRWGWFSITAAQFLPSLTITTLVATIVESLPGLSDWDNITVFAAAAFTMHLLGW